MNEDSADAIVTYMLADLKLTVASWQRRLMVECLEREAAKRLPDPSAFHFVSF